MGAIVALFSPTLLGELNWLLWGVPFSFFLLFFLLGIVWAPWILHQERNEGVSKKIEPPKVKIRTLIETPVQVEHRGKPSRVREPVPVQKRIEEPFKVEAFSSPLLRQMEDHFEGQGEAVAYPRLSERQAYLAEGFQIAYKPGTHQEVWITHGSGDHIMMLKPK